MAIEQPTIWKKLPMFTIQLSLWEVVEMTIEQRHLNIEHF
jgi:hypothetical protein